MSFKLITTDIERNFKNLVSESVESFVATAWLTKSKSLDELISNTCDIKLIVGTYGDNTDPDALQDIICKKGCNSLRLKIQNTPLYHPKLYMFRLRDRSTIVWIGSANFTHYGFNVNDELIVQIEDDQLSSKLLGWFEKEWLELVEQDVYEQLSIYRERRKKGPQYPLPDLTELVHEVHFVPDKTRKGNNYSGKLIINTSHHEYEIEYDRVKKALRVVLKALKSNNREILSLCSKEREFYINHRGHARGEKSWYLSSKYQEIKEVRGRRGRLGVEEGSRQATRKFEPTKVEDYYLSSDIGMQKAWDMIRKACKIGQVKIFPDTHRSGFVYVK